MINIFHLFRLCRSFILPPSAGFQHDRAYEDDYCRYISGRALLLIFIIIWYIPRIYFGPVRSASRYRKVPYHFHFDIIFRFRTAASRYWWCVILIDICFTLLYGIEHSPPAFWASPHSAHDYSTYLRPIEEEIGACQLDIDIAMTLLRHVSAHISLLLSSST